MLPLNKHKNQITLPQVWLLQLHVDEVSYCVQPYNSQNVLKGHPAILLPVGRILPIPFTLNNNKIWGILKIQIVTTNKDLKFIATITAFVTKLG